MRHVNEVIVNQYNQIVPGASVTVYLKGTNTKAQLYLDEGVTPSSNPSVADTLGRINFYVADGRYDLRIVGNGVDEMLYDQHWTGISSGLAVLNFADPLDLNFNRGDGLEITLTGNIAVSSAQGMQPGRDYTVSVKQDSAGAHTFAWPANFENGTTVSPEPNSRTTQKFWFDGVKASGYPPTVTP